MAAWSFIASKFAGDYKFVQEKKGPAIKSRFDLLRKFVNGDLNNLRQSGTPLEIEERFQLLTAIKSLTEAPKRTRQVPDVVDTIDPAAESFQSGNSEGHVRALSDNAANQCETDPVRLAKKRKRSKLLESIKTSMDQLSKCQRERLELDRERFRIDKKRFELERKRLQIEKERAEERDYFEDRMADVLTVSATMIFGKSDLYLILMALALMAMYR